MRELSSKIFLGDEFPHRISFGVDRLFKLTFGKNKSVRLDLRPPHIIPRDLSLKVSLSRNNQIKCQVCDQQRAPAWLAKTRRLGDDIPRRGVRDSSSSPSRFSANETPAEGISSVIETSDSKANVMRFSWGFQGKKITLDC